MVSQPENGILVCNDHHWMGGFKYLKPTKQLVNEGFVENCPKFRRLDYVLCFI